MSRQSLILLADMSSEQAYAACDQGDYARAMQLHRRAVDARHEAESSALAAFLDSVSGEV